jgi:hypothetical protein
LITWASLPRNSQYAQLLIRAEVSAVISDRDVWQAALLIVKRYGDDAMLEAAERAEQLQPADDLVHFPETSSINVNVR